MNTFTHKKRQVVFIWFASFLTGEGIWRQPLLLTHDVSYPCVFPHHVLTDDQHLLKPAGVSGTRPVWVRLLHKSPAPHYLSRYLSLDVWLILLTGTKLGQVSLLSTQPSAYFLQQDLENTLFTKAKVDFNFLMQP